MDYIFILIFFAFSRHVVDVRMNLRYRVSRRQRSSPSCDKKRKRGLNSILPACTTTVQPKKTIITGTAASVKHSKHVYEVSKTFHLNFIHLML